MAARRSVSVSKEQSPKVAEFKVLSPLGEVVVKDVPVAPRLDTLEGKTVCTVWNGSFKSNVTLGVIADLLKKKYPTVKVVPYTEMPRSFKAPPPGTSPPERTAMEAAFKDKGCDALISGNGG